MTFKIDKTEHGEFVVLTLSGRIDAEYLEELVRIVELQPNRRNITINLRQIKLANRDAVRFFERCELDGIRLEDCPSYIREWIEREKT
jgi:anti-anti-sigma regulatory factor